MNNSEKFEISGPEQLDIIAERLAELWPECHIFAFFGPMGAGKTTLIKALCAKWGVQEQVTSPTFALVNEYLNDFGNPVYHFDFYRIDHIREVYDMGYEYYFYSGYPCLIEWPEKIEQLLPDESVQIHIAYGEASNDRRIEVYLPAFLR